MCFMMSLKISMNTLSSVVYKQRTRRSERETSGRLQEVKNYGK